MNPPILQITSFSGTYRWLSNFWSCEVELDGMQFRSVEAGYVAAKTLDLEVRAQIQALDTAGKCKRFGRKLKLRPDWTDEVKLQVMEGLLRQKFKFGTQLGDYLIMTRNFTLIEGNDWGDVFWGVYNGVGDNHLGRLLMKIRDELIAQCQKF